MLDLGHDRKLSIGYYCDVTMLFLVARAAGLTLAGSPRTMSSMLRLQTGDARSATSAVDCHQQYVARKQRRNRTTFTVAQVSNVLL